MRRIFSVLVIVAVALSMGMGGAVAAQDDATNETANGTDAVVEFDDTLRVTEYDLEDESATITFESNLTQSVVVTDAMDGIGDDGVVEPYSREYELDRGETTITMDVSEVRGASAVSVVANGTEARFSAEMSEPETETEENPFRTFGGESGLFFGIGMSVTLAALGAAYVIRSEDSGVIEA